MASDECVRCFFSRLAQSLESSSTACHLVSSLLWRRVLSGRGDEQVRRSIPERIRAGPLQHDDQPGEPGRIHPPSPVEHGATDSKPIRGLHRGPGNRSDLAVQADVVEPIDLSNACSSGAFLDSERPWRDALHCTTEEQRLRRDGPGRFRGRVLDRNRSGGCEPAGEETAGRQDGRKGASHDVTIRGDS